MSTDLKISNKKLLIQLSKGNEKAFTIIYDRYWQDLYKMAFRRLQDHDTSLDIVQNVFVDIWKRKRNIKIDNLEAYLASAVRYQTYKAINKTPKYDSFFTPFEEMISSAHQADQNIIRKDLIELLNTWIQTLPSKRRKIFILHYERQLSVSEIADELSISKKTVYNQLNNSIKQLQIALASYLAIFFILWVNSN